MGISYTRYFSQAETATESAVGVPNSILYLRKVFERYTLKQREGFESVSNLKK